MIAWSFTHGHPYIIVVYHSEKTDFNTPLNDQRLLSMDNRLILTKAITLIVHIHNSMAPTITHLETMSP
jgi:hypothetical protein